MGNHISRVLFYTNDAAENSFLIFCRNPVPMNSVKSYIRPIEAATSIETLINYGF
jgi:hypothetical protein